MGCDIHAHFEIKVNGEWLHYDQPNLKRHYDLFARMANVRNSYRKEKIEPIAMPRGLPDDITKTTAFEADVYWGPDGHSHSWLSSEEIAELFEWHKKLVGGYDRYWRIEHDEWGYLCGNGWGSFHEYRDSYPKEIEDFRLVFWFDN